MYKKFVKCILNQKKKNDQEKTDGKVKTRDLRHFVKFWGQSPNKYNYTYKLKLDYKENIPNSKVLIKNFFNNISRIIL